MKAALNYTDTEARARRSMGTSERAIYRLVARAMAQHGVSGDLLIDVGCGTGSLWRYAQDRFRRYFGLDAVRYDGLPIDAKFFQADLDTGGTDLPSECADAVVAVETIEHLENPRALMRELMRLAKTGGWIIVTTPNQLSWLSLLTLLIKHRFSAFQDTHYPAHLSALLEVDLIRIAAECELTQVGIEYSCSGRIVLTPWHYPPMLSRLFPRRLSDNLLLIGKKTRDI